LIVVGTLTTAALYIGLMGMLHALVIVHCESCSHWTFTSPGSSPRSCARCHHPVLLLPSHAVRHSLHYAYGAPTREASRQR
jgi:hypothetical protein